MVARWYYKTTIQHGSAQVKLALTSVVCLLLFLEPAHTAEVGEDGSVANRGQTADGSCMTPWNRRVPNGQMATGFCPDPPYPAGLIFPREFYPGGRGCMVRKICKNGKWETP